MSNAKIRIKSVLKTQETSFPPLQACSWHSAMALAEWKETTLGDFAAPHRDHGIWRESWEGSCAQMQRWFGSIYFSLAMPPAQSYLQEA